MLLAYVVIVLQDSKQRLHPYQLETCVAINESITCLARTWFQLNMHRRNQLCSIKVVLGCTYAALSALRSLQAVSLQLFIGLQNSCLGHPSLNMGAT